MPNKQTPKAAKKPCCLNENANGSCFTLAKTNKIKAASAKRYDTEASGATSPNW